MNVHGKRFEIDKANGKVLGVCAGIANMTGIDATIIRIGLVIVTVMWAFPWALVAYGVAALVGTPRGAGSDYALSRTTSRSREEARERIRALDLRMQAIETQVTSSNSRLAREIEELR
jgi:phage shock protein C